ncbi:MAG: type IX secretion system membrane protein PorP/SprF [Bacteroidia bacterium]|jgi:type IX secretion system PorP/SprF family membrane protein|nr:type IX secretion system membrane protein PorP/SprF [Bacteroidia bacterium]
MKALIKIHLIIIGTLLSVVVYAQQEPMYSQYMFNTMALNPAYAGSREVISTTLLGRAQWLGIEGAPKSQTLSIDAPIRNKKIGIGLIAFNDKIGLSRNTGIHGSYAYRIRFERTTLSMGLKLGIVHYTANLSQAALSTGNTSDDRGFQNNLSTLIPSAGAGIFFNSDKYYLGISAPNLYSRQIILDQDIKINKDNHIFLMGGYVFTLNNDIKLKPSGLMKFVKGAPIQFDLNTNVWFYDLLGLGVSYRTGDAIVGMVELQVRNNFRVGYSYDYTTTQLQKYNSGTHEIMLRFEFGFGKDKIVTPRYF